ncbi:MAG: 5-formyltetrahydrofolate cyclo-ligase [Bacteroidales bacterium]|nr:5-formyltetrahydrofolate cyclo-ligase [Candidatus Cacconaster merdequi]
MDKHEIRRVVKERIGGCFDCDCASLWRTVEDMPQFRSASTVLMYWSLPDEVPTVDFIRKWSRFKKILLPVVNGDNLLLKEYSENALVKGYRGIMEPSLEAAPASFQNVDFSIVPGVAFDRSCNRMGRGKGFYDRTLPHISGFKAGVCFDFQLFDSIPVDPWDVPVDAVITTKERI